MSIRTKAIQGSLWLALHNWGAQGGSLLIFLLLTRLLDPDAFGLVALANVYVAFMQVFLNQVFSQELIQRQDLEPEHIDAAFWITLAMGMVLVLVGIGGAEQIALLFKQPDLSPLVQVLSLIFLIMPFSSIPQALLKRQFRFKAIALSRLLGIVVGGGVGIGLAFNNFGVWSLVGQQMAYELVGAMALWLLSQWQPRWQFSPRHFSQLFNFGIHILGLNFLGFINTRADDFLIGYFLGTTALGYYSVAYRILTAMTEILVETSSQLALPTFSRLQDDLDRFRKAFYTATQLTSVIAFPTFLALLVLAPNAVELLFGDQWLPSVPVLRVLSLVGLLRSISYFKGSVFMALGKPSWNLLLRLLSSSLNIVGFMIAVRWGIVAVAWAYLGRGVIILGVGQWAISRLIEIPLWTYLQQFWAAAASSILMAVVIWQSQQRLDLWWDGSIVNAIAALLLGILCYGLVLWVLSPHLVHQLGGIYTTAFASKKSS